ncbi:type II toxin-antitoxin system HicA family toxin [Saccharomonospora piscinae]|nr:type II toxin-antitoxin system HicA family toxin [Saccharomonospora piscinae]
MVRSMRYRDVMRALLDHDCMHKSTKGSHEKWLCPCGSHIAIVPNHKVVSPGVVGDVIKKFACLPRGWLQ